MSDVRVRFAPSPTGYLHVGGARTVLFNWIYARQRGGEFKLRIEDTDTERNRPELTDNILDMIRWLGFDWDGDPVHASERLDQHQEAAAKLFASGHAYWCDCTPEAIQARAKERGGPPGYDGFCRDRGLEAGPGRALRFRTPDDGVTSFHDIVRGEVSVPNASLEDFVILRSTGIPPFLLANAVDDADMGITHVLRGEEHVNGTPKYLLIREALGLGAPAAFAHLPVLVNERRKKLSKRFDAVSVAEFKERGFLPEAMVNYLALLGWGPPDGVEIRPFAEIVELFRLEDVNSAPAFFDVKKLEHFNGEYIRALPIGEFVERAIPFLPDGEPGAPDALRALAAEVQTRVKTLAEVVVYVDFLYLDEPKIDEAAWKRVTNQPESAAIFEAALDAFAAVEWESESIHQSMVAISEQLELHIRKVQEPVRVAITGRTVGPPLWESLVVLGREKTLARLRAARARL